MSAVKNDLVVWKQSTTIWLALVASATAAIGIFSEGLSYMVEMWSKKEEYSYGYLIPFIVLFLIWQKKATLERLPFRGSWSGVLVMLAGVLFFLVGSLSTLYVVIQYAFLLTLAGVVLAMMGWAGFRVILVPLLVLAFMIPLPEFLLQGISGKLQLLSSEIGVWVIRLFGISVFLEGNVIDLGAMKLQVVEACNGLRYLFPLMTFGFITAYFFRAEWWKRALIFLSTIPITVLMNSFRIGVIGVTVEYWGQSMAEGFLHDFEGWLVFMACTALLFGEMWLLSRIGGARRPLREVFGLEFPAPTPRHARIEYRPLPPTFIAAVGLLLVVWGVATIAPHPEEIVPARQDFSQFPESFGDWHGSSQRMQQIYVDALKFDDYLLVSFSDGAPNPVTLYSAYYGSQRTGESAHSPRTCMPGGGWEITQFDQRVLSEVNVNGQPLRVNRALIQLRDQTQLVYYWFQQRGRSITNEYLVKWYLFWDALTRNRSDGALVRVTVYVPPGQNLAIAESRLQRFVEAAVPKLEPFVPN